MKMIFNDIIASGKAWKERFWFNSLIQPKDVQLVLAYFGESHAFGGYEFFRAQGTRFYSLEYVVHGHGLLTYSDGTRFHLSPGTLYLLHPGIGSRISIPQDGDLQKIVIGFANGALLQLMLHASPLGSGEIFRPAEEEQFKRQMEKIGQMVRRSPEENELSTECYRLLLSLKEHTAHDAATPMQSICEYMQSQLNSPLTLEELSRMAGISKVTLIRKFRSAFSCTPMQYLIRLRLNYARTLLQLQHMPVTEVATLCGYRNARFFSREYHRHFGIPPSREPRDKSSVSEKETSTPF